MALLGWFSSGTVDHALADPKESRRVIEGLPSDSLKALGEVIFWLHSVNATDGFRLERRLQLVSELDQAARSHLRKLARDYRQTRRSRAGDNQAWTAQADFWRLTATGYVQCVEGVKAGAPGSVPLKTRLPVIVGRALRAIGQQLKWSLLHYGPVDGLLWTDLGSLYAFAEAQGFVEAEVPLYEGAMGTTSARNECLKTVMLAVVSTDSLPFEQIEIAERSVALFSKHYVLQRTSSPPCPYVFDLATSKPPGRLRQEADSEGASVRYFGPGAAGEEMNHLFSVLMDRGQLPRDVSLGTDYPPTAVADVWRHLLRCWSDKPPERVSTRHVAQVRLSVVHDFEGLFGVLTAKQEERSLDFSEGVGPTVETWFADNASVGGYGALVPVRGSEWVHVGTLIGVKVEGDRYWGAGLVRRMWREREQNWILGIQLLANVVVPLTLAPCGEQAGSNAAQEIDQAILLTPRPDSDRSLTIMLRSGRYSPGQALVMQVHNQAFEIEPVRLLEGSDEFEIARFVLVRRVA